MFTTTRSIQIYSADDLEKTHPSKRIILETVTVRMCLLTLDLH